MFNVHSGKYSAKKYYSVAVKEVVRVSTFSGKVYWKDSKGKLCAMALDKAEDHEEAIISVKESLVQSREVWENPILTVIQGGKK